MAACERIFRLLDTPPEIVNPAKPKIGDGSNRIEFRHVWFTYKTLTASERAAVQQAAPGASPVANLLAIDGIEWILKDVSFTVEPGQTVAIVGPHRSRQNHAHQPDDAVLRRNRGPDSA